MQAQDLRILVYSQILVSPCFFLKGLRTTVEVELFNFQDCIQESGFDSYFIKRLSLTLPEKIERNHNICQRLYSISSLTDMLVLPQNF